MWLERQVAFVVGALAPILLIAVPLTVAHLKRRRAEQTGADPGERD